MNSYTLHGDFDFDPRHEDCEYERPARRSYYSCSDGFCGALDCPRCSPGSYDQDENEEREEQSEAVVKRVTARKARYVGTPREIKPGDRVRIESWFTYKPKGPRTGYHHSYTRIAKGPAWGTN
jgi:hypothetical protein